MVTLVPKYAAQGYGRAAVDYRCYDNEERSLVVCRSLSVVLRLTCGKQPFVLVSEFSNLIRLTYFYYHKE